MLYTISDTPTKTIQIFINQVKDIVYYFDYGYKLKYVNIKFTENLVIGKIQND